jgi:hypothetical protein
MIWFNGCVGTGMVPVPRNGSPGVKRNTPILDALIASGVVWIESHEYVGLAADGVRVSFGTAFDDNDATGVESYLRDHPTPDTW